MTIIWLGKEFEVKTFNEYIISSWRSKYTLQPCIYTCTCIWMVISEALWVFYFLPQHLKWNLGSIPVIQIYIYIYNFFFKFTVSRLRLEKHEILILFVLFISAKCRSCNPKLIRTIFEFLLAMYELKLSRYRFWFKNRKIVLLQSTKWYLWNFS